MRTQPGVGLGWEEDLRRDGRERKDETDHKSWEEGGEEFILFRGSHRSVAYITLLVVPYQEWTGWTGRRGMDGLDAKKQRARGSRKGRDGREHSSMMLIQRFRALLRSIDDR